MRKPFFLGANAFLALAGAVVLAHGPALAASPDDLEREKAQLRKENADLRKLLRMRDENAAMHRRLGQGRVELAARGVQPPAFESYAADLPVKAAPPMLAVYNWTGFYVGGNIGYGVGNDRASQVEASSVVVNSTFTDATVAPRGATGGVQFGYNWQGGRNWLVGFETDFQAASQTDKTCTFICERSGGSEQTLSVEHKVEYFGTVRARLGAVVDNVLFYGTGGGAYGRVIQTGFFAPSSGVSTGETRFGWTAGGGIEAALWGNWTAKAEYLYLNLGDTKPNIFGGVIPAMPTPEPFTISTTGNIRDHIVRAGVNYRFGDAPLNAYASAGGYGSPAYNWSGFYVGANAGYGAGVNHLSQVTTDSPSFAGNPSSLDSVITPKGFLGGVQLGYNWQGGRNWLVGFEADIQGTNQSDKACAPLACISNSFGNGAITAQQQLDWFGTVRGRVGVVNNNILFFATGGVAFGQVKETIAENDTFGANFNSSTNSFNQVGWAAGGGIEAALAGNWTAKAEYLYLDLGAIKSTFTDVNQTITNTSSVRDHVFRAGVNYRF